ncbi:MAG: hypothetical protein EAX95_07440 [Candidatus Thorarchaeota archaeon]|nr:hypothetical protein [Candidatus Thorarchaeota archaeon]
MGYVPTSAYRGTAGGLFGLALHPQGRLVLVGLGWFIVRMFVSTGSSATYTLYYSLEVLIWAAAISLSVLGAKTDSIGTSIAGCILGVFLISMGWYYQGIVYSSGDYSLYSFLLATMVMDIAGTVLAIFSVISLGLIIQKSGKLPAAKVTGLIMLVLGSVLWIIGLAEGLAVVLLDVMGLLPEEIWWYDVMPLASVFFWLFFSLIVIGTCLLHFENKAVSLVGFLAGIGVGLAAANGLTIPIPIGGFTMNAAPILGQLIYTLFGISLGITLTKGREPSVVKKQDVYMADHTRIEFGFADERAVPTPQESIDEERVEEKDDDFELDL